MLAAPEVERVVEVGVGVRVAAARELARESVAELEVELEPGFQAWVGVAWEAALEVGLALGPAESRA